MEKSIKKPQRKLNKCEFASHCKGCCENPIKKAWDKHALCRPDFIKNTVMTYKELTRKFQ